MNTRLNPDSEENKAMTRDNERAVFAAKMMAVEDFWVIRAMHVYGGDFCKQLGKACMLADDHNLDRIKTAFPELWAKYSVFGKTLKEQEQESEP